jgi:hypothetical protein
LSDPDQHDILPEYKTTNTSNTAYKKIVEYEFVNGAKTPENKQFVCIAFSESENRMYKSDPAVYPPVLV